MSGAELAPPPTREEPGRYVGNVPILTGVRNPRSMPQVLFLVRVVVGVGGWGGRWVWGVTCAHG